jgi:hypothetical protein
VLSSGLQRGEDDGLAFGYTVGMFGLGHDELLVFGLGAHDTAGLLNTVGDMVQAGDTIIPGQALTVGTWPHQIIPERVPNPGEIVYSANRFYRRPDRHSVDVLQLTYDDRNGLFPWKEGFEDPDAQPRPGTFGAGQNND